MTWYGRLTDSEAVRHEPRARRRRIMDTDQTVTAEAVAAQVSGTLIIVLKIPPA